MRYMASCFYDRGKKGRLTQKVSQEDNKSNEKVCVGEIENSKERMRRGKEAVAGVGVRGGG